MDTLKTDVLIIGSGAAGLRAAIAARQEGLDVLIISKASPGKSSCTIFSGGVFASSPAGRPTEPHRRRTLLAGRGINQADLVDALVEEAPARLKEMIDWGLSATFHKGYLHCQGQAPLWGRDIIRCLLARNKDLETQFMGGIQAFRLQADENIFSLMAYAPNASKWLAIFAPAVVLATGGAAALYLRHDNPKGMLGDGYGLALEAGATLQDMEFVQYYPLGLAEPGFPPFLIPPALADLGRVVNNHGEDILVKYAVTERPVAERARDLFSRVLFQEIYREHHTVWLDLRDLSEEDWQADPFTASTRRILGDRYGARQRPVRIAPMAHHVMGGVCIDPNGATTVPGLFAAGEVTGGLHGANRMGGNALSETLVFGRRAGHSAAAWAAGKRKSGQTGPLKHLATPSPPMAPPVSLTAADEDFRNLQRILWKEGGIIRMEQGLKQALHGLEHTGVKDAIKTCFAFRTATLILQAALKRQESRGAHYREDFPATNDKRWHGHLRVRLDPNGLPQWEYKPMTDRPHAKPQRRQENK